MMMIKPALSHGSAAPEEKSHSVPFLRQGTIFISVAVDNLYNISTPTNVLIYLYKKKNARWQNHIMIRVVFCIAIL